ASLMIRTLIAVQNLDLGIRTTKILTARIPLATTRYSDASRRNAFLRQVLDNVQSMPGVVSGALNSGLHPMGAMAWAVRVPGNPDDDRRVLIHQVSEDYAATM